MYRHDFVSSKSITFIQICLILFEIQVRAEKTNHTSFFFSAKYLIFSDIQYQDAQSLLDCDIYKTKKFVTLSQSVFFFSLQTTEPKCIPRVSVPAEGKYKQLTFSTVDLLSPPRLSFDNQFGANPLTMGTVPPHFKSKLILQLLCFCPFLSK